MVALVVVDKLSKKVVFFCVRKHALVYYLVFNVLGVAWSKLPGCGSVQSSVVSSKYAAC